MDKVGPGAIQLWNELHPDEAIAPGDRIIEVNGVTGSPASLLQACCEADKLVLIVQFSGQTTARSQSCESSDSFGSVPELSLLGAMDMCGMPLETPTLDRCMPAFHSSSKPVGMPTFEQHPCGEMARRSNEMILETPTLDRCMPTLYVPCKSERMPTFGNQHSEEMAIRCWTSNESHDSMELSIPTQCQTMQVCGVPLETPTLDRNPYSMLDPLEVLLNQRKGHQLNLANYLS